MDILLFILIGLTVGVVSGTLGIGGGVLLVPILMWVFGYSHPKAIGTTLGVLIPPVGLLAAMKYYQQNLMDVSAAIWIALTFAIGAYFGAILAPLLPNYVLRILFGMMLIYIGVRFVLNADREVMNTAAGIAMVAVSWGLFLLLRAIGRRYRPHTLRAVIRRKDRTSAEEPDYYI